VTSPVLLLSPLLIQPLLLLLQKTLQVSLTLLLPVLLRYSCSCTQFAAVAATVCHACTAAPAAAPGSGACCLPKHAALIGAFLHLLLPLLPAAAAAAEGPPSEAQTEPLL
jgi:hypothetical protein